MVSLVIFAAADHSTPPGDDNWSRQVVEALDPSDPFELTSTSSIDGQLSAICVYHYVPTRRVTVLHGVKSAQTDLSPFVTYELAGEDKTNWRAIGKFFTSANSASVEVSAANPSALLTVDMEPFRPSIGRVRWGRIVLETGEAAIFAIDNLLPTGNSPGAAAGNFKQEISDFDARRYGSAYRLVSVTSISNHITGDFIFIGNSGANSVKIEGSQTGDGEFWPFVTLQAGNSEKDWQTLGKAEKHMGTFSSLKLSNQGTLSPVRIRLDDYRTAVGTGGYGKIIFSDGSFAVFELAQLKPH